MDQADHGLMRWVKRFKYDVQSGNITIDANKEGKKGWFWQEKRVQEKKARDFDGTKKYKMGKR